MKELTDKLNAIYDTKYTDNELSNKFLLKLYGGYISGSFVKECRDYNHMEAHFDLDYGLHYDKINISECTEIYHITNKGFERLL